MDSLSSDTAVGSDTGYYDGKGDGDVPHDVVEPVKAEWLERSSVWDAMTGEESVKAAESRELESSGSEWLNSIWEAIDFSDPVEEEKDQTIQVVAPKRQDPGTEPESFVTWKYEQLSPRPLLEYPLNISPKDPRELGTCVTCKKDVAVVVLHGDNLQLQEPHIADLTCVRCHLGGGEEAAADPPPVTIRVASSWNRKRRGVGSGAMVWCDICNHLIAYGGMRLQSSDSGWHEPSFTTEYLCANCVPDFNNCSACGGQRKFRSGKWRPRQLFEPGRRNCVAQHLNQKLKAGGKGPRYHVLTYRVPNQPLSDVSQFDPEPTIYGDGDFDPAADLKSVERVLKFKEAYVSSMLTGWIAKILTAPEMRQYPYIWDWPRVVQSTAGLIRRTERLFYIDFKNDRLRRYMALGYHAGDNGVVNVSNSYFCWYPDDRHVMIGSGGSFGPKIHRPKDAEALLERIRLDVELLGIPLPEFFWATYFPRASDAGQDPYTLTYGPMISLTRYARDRSLDEESIKVRLRKASTFIDAQVAYVLPWENRARLHETM